MSLVLPIRLALALVAAWAARRARRPRGLLLAGAAGAAASLGPGPVSLPAAVALGAGLLAAALLLSLLRSGVHSRLATEAAWDALALAASSAAVVAVVVRSGGVAEALLGAGAIGSALAVHGAAGCLANAEAGWRRGLGWAGAVLLPGLVGGGVLALDRVLPSRFRALAPAAALLVALLAWVVPFVFERRRVLVELDEEARLGILPAEDLSVLGSPWRRSREPRFGRTDERREYVRSALLLAVARHQQRRRSGEAIRLRQLEVLAFRTRVRRAVEGRGARFAEAVDEPAV